MELNLKLNDKQYLSIEQSLKGFEKQMPSIMLNGLTQIAYTVRYDEKKEMQRVFDRPTPFTLNSLVIFKATKQKPEATVALRDPAGIAFSDILKKHYLVPQIYGGSRALKKFEKRVISSGYFKPNSFLMPGQGVKMNKYGNVNKGDIQKILSGLKAQFDPQRNQKGKGKARKRRLKNRNNEYFAVGNQTKSSRLAPGVYERYRFAAGTSIKPVFMIGRKPRYKKLFRFFEVAEDSITKNWKREMEDAVERAVRTAR